MDVDVDLEQDSMEEKEVMQFRHGNFMDQAEAAKTPFISKLNSILNTELVDLRIPTK